jgi:2-polyprenyl-3-methyl-5-hydroxy-6-metoxy-1,4-benzoquinol methylase
LHHPDIHFHNQGVQDDPTPVLQAEGGPFDVVVSTEVVEHLFSPHLLPQYAAKLLGDNGQLIVTTPYHGFLKNLVLSLVNGWDKHHTALWHGGHIKFWSRRTLTRLLEDNGFEVTGFFGVGRLPFLWKSMVVVARKRGA